MSKVVNDLNKALLHIKSKHNGEIPYQYGSRECAKLMDSYAKEYHEHKLKILGIVGGVVGQSEQLADHKCKPMVNADWTYLRCECGKRFEPKG